MKNCIVVVGHALLTDTISMFERMLSEAPRDHEIFFLFVSDDPPDMANLPPALATRLIHFTSADLLRTAYPEKCRVEGWTIAGNLDIAFLDFWRAHPEFDRYWFVEYDVHYEGRWAVFFDYFGDSDADVLGTTLLLTREKPQKLAVLEYPPLVVPPECGWTDDQTIKGFFPIVRLSHEVLRVLDEEYRRGLGGHYEVTMPTVAAIRGLEVEDVGGRGRFVKPENRDRFYFATDGTFTHSPGTFVFRPPITKVLARKNTLWHPIKPPETPHWFPTFIKGSSVKTLLESLKPYLWRNVIRLWFATRWNPLP